MRHEESRKCHLQLRDTIEVDPEMAQMLKLGDWFLNPLFLYLSILKNYGWKIENMHE